MDKAPSKNRVSWDSQISIAQRKKRPELDTKKQLLSNGENGVHSGGPYLRDLELPRAAPRRRRSSRLAKTLDAATVPLNPTVFRPTPALPSVDSVCLPSTPPILSQRHGRAPSIDDAALPFERSDDSSEESDPARSHILLSYEIPEVTPPCLENICIPPNMRQPTVEMYCGEPIRPCSVHSAPSIDSVSLPVVGRSVRKRILFRSKSTKV